MNGFEITVPMPGQQSLGIIDEAYTDFVNAKRDLASRKKSIDLILRNDKEYMEVETERARALSKRKIRKAKLMEDPIAAKQLADLNIKKLEVEGRRERLSGHLVNYAKSNGHVVKLPSGKASFYIKESAKLQKMKGNL